MPSNSLQGSAEISGCHELGAEAMTIVSGWAGQAPVWPVQLRP